MILKTFIGTKFVWWLETFLINIIFELELWTKLKKTKWGWVDHKAPILNKFSLHISTRADMLAVFFCVYKGGINLTHSKFQVIYMMSLKSYVMC